MQIKKQHLELDMEQQTGSNLGKKYIKAVYYYPVYLTYMQSTACEMLGWMKHKLKSSPEKYQMAPHSSTLAWKIHGWRSMVGCSPWGREESDTTERLHSHFLLSCIGEGNGNPLQCSCLENPRDGGAWWAAVSGVAHD